MTAPENAVRPRKRCRYVSFRGLHHFDGVFERDEDQSGELSAPHALLTGLVRRHSLSDTVVVPRLYVLTVETSSILVQ